MPEGFDPPKQSAETRLIIKAWNMLGGMEWAGIPLVAEILGYDDLEIMITELATIRDRQRND